MHPPIPSLLQRESPLAGVNVTNLIYHYLSPCNYCVGKRGVAVSILTYQSMPFSPLFFGWYKCLNEMENEKNRYKEQQKIQSFCDLMRPLNMS